MLGLLVTSICHWACPFRWSWYRHVLWFYPSLDLAVHLPLVLSLFCWRPLGSSVVREFTQLTSFLTGLLAQELHVHSQPLATT